VIRLGIAAACAAAGVACLFVGLRAERPATSGPIESRTIHPEPQLRPRGDSLPSVERSAATREPEPPQAVGLASTVEQLLFAAEHPLTSGDIRDLVARGAFTRSEFTHAALRALAADARGSARLVGVEEGAAALRDDSATSRETLDLAAAYFEIDTPSQPHAWLRVRLAGWPAPLATFAGLLRADARDVERLAGDALAGGGPEGRAAVVSALEHWIEADSGLEVGAVVRALHAAPDASEAASVLVEIVTSRRGGDVFTVWAAIDAALGPHALAQAPWGAELRRLALESESASVRQVAILTAVGSPPTDAGREFAESVVLGDPEGLLGSSALEALAPAIPPSRLIALGGALRREDAAVIVASALRESLERFPEERSIVVDFVRQARSDGKLGTDDVAASVIRRLRLVELEPDLAATADERGAPARFASVPADASLLEAVRAAEAAPRRIRIEGTTRVENWNEEAARFDLAEESEWTAHYPGTPGGRERVHFHRRVEPREDGSDVSEAIEAYDGRVERIWRRDASGSVGREARKRTGPDVGDDPTGWSFTLHGFTRKGLRVSDTMTRPGVVVGRDDGEVVIEARDVDWSWVQRLDARRGFAVTSAETRVKGHLYEKYEAHAFLDAGGGVHYPSSATRTLYDASERPRQRTQFDCRLAAANEESWGDEVYRLEFPEGAAVEGRAGGAPAAAAPVAEAAATPVAPLRSNDEPPATAAPAPVVSAAVPAAPPEPSRGPWVAAGVALLAAAGALLIKK